MKSVALLIGTLMQSRNQAHIYHLQTQGPGSFATHKALEDYYGSIIPLIDSIVESVQGRYGIVTGYQTSNVIKEDNDPTSYFTSLCKFVELVRKQIPQDSYIQNEIDEVVKLIESTKYKLTYLQ